MSYILKGYMSAQHNLNTTWTRRLFSLSFSFVRCPVQ
jgi:hypothetical protein